MKSIFEEIDEKPDADLVSSFNETVDMVALLNVNLGLKVMHSYGYTFGDLVKMRISDQTRYTMPMDYRNVSATIATNNWSSAINSEDNVIRPRIISRKFVWPMMRTNKIC